MTLDEAKARRDVFMERHGNRLREMIYAPPTPPERLVVDRETFEAIEEAFQHWPMRDEHGEEFVGNACFTDPKIQPSVMFKGVPVTYEHA